MAKEFKNIYFLILRFYYGGYYYYFGLYFI